MNDVILYKLIFLINCIVGFYFFAKGKKKILSLAIGVLFLIVTFIDIKQFPSFISNYYFLNNKELVSAHLHPSVVFTEETINKDFVFTKKKDLGIIKKELTSLESFIFNHPQVLKKVNLRIFTDKGESMYVISQTKTQGTMMQMKIDNFSYSAFKSDNIWSIMSELTHTKFLKKVHD